MYNDNRQNFISQMPFKPYCSNNLDYGLTIRKREKALEMLYIQANQPAIQTCLLFDIDKENSFYTFEEAGLPVPQFITKSPDSGRCHYGYILRTGVCKTQQARLKPLKYAAAVEIGMAEALGSDRGYVGLVTKNPLNSHWSPYWSGADLYDLDFLADCVDLTTSNQTEKSENYGLGRNVNLFENLRFYAYKHVLSFKKSSNFDLFLAELERQAININTVCNVGNLLPYNEVKATVKSICRWTWKNFDSATFSKIQSNRAKKPRKTNAKNEMLDILRNGGVL